MNWKEFLKPSWKKIIISFIILVVVFYFAPCKVGARPNYVSWKICGQTEHFPAFFDPTWWITDVFFYFFGVIEIPANALLVWILVFISSYLFSSLLFFILRVKRKSRDSS